MKAAPSFLFYPWTSGLELSVEAEAVVDGGADAAGGFAVVAQEFEDVAQVAVFVAEAQQLGDVAAGEHGFAVVDSQNAVVVAVGDVAFEFAAEFFVESPGGYLVDESGHVFFELVDG